MWPLVYMSLLNAGLGFALAAWAYRRCLCAKRWRQQGYDQRIFCPPFNAGLNRLRRRRPFDIDKVLQRLGSTQPVENKPDVPNAADMPNKSDLSDPSDVAEVSDLSDVSGKLEKPEKPDDSNKSNKSNLPHKSDVSDVSEVSDVSDASDASEKLDLSDLSDVSNKSDASDLSDLSDLPGESNRLNASDPSDVPDRSELSNKSDLSDRSDVSEPSDLSDVSDRSEVSELANTRGQEEKTAAVIAGGMTKERTPEIWNASNPGAISERTASEAKQIFSLPQTNDDDFLARAAVIDSGLQALLALERGSVPTDANSQQATAIWQEITTQVQATHHWWTDFEGTLTEKLSRGAGRPIHPEQRAQVEDDLVAMQASLMECQSLLDEALSATAPPVPPRRDGGKAAQNTAPARVRSGLMGAIKACHHLRDNLVMLLPEPPLRFHSGSSQALPKDDGPTIPPVSYVTQQGLAGATATVQNWQSQLTADTPNVASLLLVDFDRTNHWNQRLGLQALDWILDSCHHQIAESIRHNRGFDRVVRVGGQQFLVFLGSTPVASAKFAADRLRQVFEQTTWEVADQSIAVHCSLTVGSFRANQPLAAQINGLRLGMAEAKRLGGNVVVEPSPTGRFQQIAGVPTYSLPPRRQRQPCEKWNPKAAVNC